MSGEVEYWQAIWQARYARDCRERARACTDKANRGYLFARAQRAERHVIEFADRELRRLANLSSPAA